jgi:hypothetical protein
MSVVGREPTFTLPDLVEQFERDEALENDDVLTDLSRLTMLDHETVDIPGIGPHRFNEWSRRQAESTLGVRFSRWFEYAEPREIADEMNRRFTRAEGPVRLRTRRAPAGGAGELRAMLGPGYSPVADSTIGRLLIQALEPYETELRILRHAATEKTVSYVVAVGRPYRIGGPGEVGDVWGGIFVRNSCVGYASLTLTLHCTRLVCRNGMVAPLPDSRLVRRVHRGLDTRLLEERLQETLRSVPARLRAGGEQLARSVGVAVLDVETTVRDLLADRGMPARLVAAIMAAYAREPSRTVFGVSQALTLAAQAVTVEEGHELEALAGAYVHELVG